MGRCFLYFPKAGVRHPFIYPVMNEFPGSKGQEKIKAKPHAQGIAPDQHLPELLLQLGDSFFS